MSRLFFSLAHCLQCCFSTLLLSMFTQSFINVRLLQLQCINIRHKINKVLLKRKKRKKNTGTDVSFRNTEIITSGEKEKKT